MTVKEIIEDVQHKIHTSQVGKDWYAWIEAIPNPTPGATRFPIQYEEHGTTRGNAIKNLYEKLKGQGGLVSLRSEKL